MKTTPCLRKYPTDLPSSRKRPLLREVISVFQKKSSGSSRRIPLGSLEKDPRLSRIKTSSTPLENLWVIQKQDLQILKKKLLFQSSIQSYIKGLEYSRRSHLGLLGEEIQFFYENTSSRKILQGLQEKPQDPWFSMRRPLYLLGQNHSVVYEKSSSISSRRPLSLKTNLLGFQGEDLWVLQKKTSIFFLLKTDFYKKTSINE